jgi:hypothetical protein
VIHCETFSIHFHFGCGIWKLICCLSDALKRFVNVNLNHCGCEKILNQSLILSLNLNVICD